MAPLPDIGVAVADILPFPRPITEEPPERKCWADEERELAAEIYAVCKGRDCRAELPPWPMLLAILALI
jgi:hypothetical protein